jgi:hypothetical protein
VRPWVVAFAFVTWACGSQVWSFDQVDGGVSLDAGRETGGCADDDECSADASVCSLPRGVCIRCASDLDCVNAVGGRICAVATGRCVDCVMDTDCPSARPRCNTSTDRCVRCLTNADCGRESFCINQACTTMF